MSLYNGLPLFDHGAHLVLGDVYAVQDGEAVFVLNVLSDELELANGHFIVLQVGEAHLQDVALEGGDLGSLGPSDEGVPNISDVEHGWFNISHHTSLS